MIVQLSFDLENPHDRILYDRCMRIINPPMPMEAPLARFWGALGENPRRLIMATRVFKPDQVWHLPEWAAAAGMSLDQARNLLGSLGRVERSQGWSPFEKAQAQDCTKGSFSYRFTPGAWEELQALCQVPAAE